MSQAVFNTNVISGTADAADLVITGLVDYQVLTTIAGILTPVPLGTRLTLGANLNVIDNPTFTGITIGSLTGIPKLTTGLLSVLTGTNTQYLRGDYSFATLDTSAVPENGNLYFTNARAISATSGSYEPSLGLGTSTQYLRGDRLWKTLDTSVVAENTNLYFLSSRAIAACSGTYEPIIAAGLTTQYWKGNKTWATLNQAAVAGLTTADSPSFSGITVGSLTGLLKAAAGVVSAAASSDYVASITGTANQVIANASTGAVTLSLPQSINTGATVQFAKINVNTTAPNWTTGIHVAGTLTAGTGGATFSANAVQPDSGSGFRYCQYYAAGGYTIGNNQAQCSGVMVDAATKTGAGTVTLATGGYFAGPSMSATNSVGIYTDSLSVGYTTPGIMGTGNIIGSGRLFLGSTPVSSYGHQISTSFSVGAGQSLYYWLINPYSLWLTSLGQNLYISYISASFNWPAGTGGNVFGLQIDGAAFSKLTGGTPSNGYGAYIVSPAIGATNGLGLYTDSFSVGTNGAWTDRTTAFGHALISAGLAIAANFTPSACLTVGSASTSLNMTNGQICYGIYTVPYSSCVLGASVTIRGIECYPQLNGGGGIKGTVANYSGYYGHSFYVAAGGSVTNAYQMYLDKPNFGATVDTALYAADCCIGSTVTPPASGLYVNGIIKNMAITANSLVYADNTNQFQSASSWAAQLGYLAIGTAGISGFPLYVNQVATYGTNPINSQISGTVATANSGNNCTGLCVNTALNQGGTKNCTNFYELYVQSVVTGAATNTITNVYGAYIDAISTSTSVVTNTWGLYVKTPLLGTTRTCAEFQGPIIINGVPNGANVVQNVTFTFGSTNTTVPCVFTMNNGVASVFISAFTFNTTQTNQTITGSVPAAYKPTSASYLSHMYIMGKINGALTTFVLQIDSTGTLTFLSNTYTSFSNTSPNVTGNHLGVTFVYQYY